MSEIKQFEYYFDWTNFCKWWKDYNDNPPHLSMIPPTGFISNEAAGFLIKTDTELCIIEYLIVRKDFSGDRKKAMKQIIQALMKNAKTSGFKKIMGITNIESVQDIAQQLGFKLTNSIFLERTL